MGKRSTAERPTSGMNVRQALAYRPIKQTEVCWTLKAPLFANEAWRCFADGVVLLFAIGIFGEIAFAQGQPLPERPETEARLSRQLSGDTEQKRSALFEIRNIQTEQASRLAIPSLTDANEMVRATAASSVVFLRESEAAFLLRPLLSDKAEFVRREAAYALGETGTHIATTALVKLMLEDKVLEVRTAAAAALGKTGDVEAVESLTAILKKKPREDDEFLRRSAARSIGRIAQIMRTGKSGVLTPQNFLPDKYKDTDANTNKSLSPGAFATAVTILTQVLQNINESDDTRRESAFALGAIGDRTATTVLETHRNSSDPYLAEICKEALLKIERSK